MSAETSGFSPALLAARLAHRRRHLRRGRLDIRNTVRHSLSTGGLLADPRFKAPRLAKPDIVLLCDISGSVATFAHFTMQLMYAMASQFSRVRAFASMAGELSTPVTTCPARARYNIRRPVPQPNSSHVLPEGKLSHSKKTVARRLLHLPIKSS